MTATMVCVLCALVILKPQEFIPILAGVPIVHIFFFLCVVTSVADVATGKIRLSAAPHVPLAIAFFVWGALVTFVRSPITFSKELNSLTIVLCLFSAVALLSGTERGVRNVCTAYLMSALFASVVAILQADAPLGCMMAGATDWEAKDILEFDGRPCETSLDCRKDPPVWNANYRCEHVGSFGTSTINGRVRYRGTLADPNDLSLTAALALPIAVALSERASSKTGSTKDQGESFWSGVFRISIMMTVIAVVGTMIILSQSRMGVLIFLLVVGLALLRRAGSWGIVLGLILLPPVLLFGGRDSAEADASSQERLELISDALTMIRRSHGVGVGMGRFADESSTGLTAHNSYLLAASETGIVGIILFSLMLYAAIKVPFTLWFGKNAIDASLKRWASALTISLVGAYVGIFFLSWAYKEILYILLGLSAALYGAARKADPELTITLGAREIAIVVCLALSFVPMVYGIVRIVG
jgi:hypothetical protein